jgi:hypothetical protein
MFWVDGGKIDLSMNWSGLCVRQVAGSGGDDDVDNIRNSIASIGIDSWCFHPIYHRNPACRVERIDVPAGVPALWPLVPCLVRVCASPAGTSWTISSVDIACKLDCLHDLSIHHGEACPEDGRINMGFPLSDMYRYKEKK